MSDLAKRMRDAADTLEEVSRVYDYMYPDEAKWSAHRLRHEIPFVEENQANAIRSTLRSYSEWLESEGAMVGDHLEPRDHDELIADFFGSLD